MEMEVLGVFILSSSVLAALALRYSEDSRRLARRRSGDLLTDEAERKLERAA